jgi:hypothetical protein
MMMTFVVRFNDLSARMLGSIQAELRRFGWSIDDIASLNTARMALIEVDDENLTVDDKWMSKGDEMKEGSV